MRPDIDPRLEIEPPARLKDLESLAQAVSLDSRLRLRVGQPGDGWRVNAATRVVTCDLSVPLSDAQLRALVLHEAGHLVVSHYHDFLAAEPPGPAEADWLPLVLNAVEDLRLERWLRSRYPACAPWLESVNAAFMPRSVDGLDPLPSYLAAIATEQSLGRPLAVADPRVVAALTATREILDRCLACQPPVVATGEPASIPPPPGPAPATAFEATCRAAAWEAYRIIRDELLPRLAGLRAAEPVPPAGRPRRTSRPARGRPGAGALDPLGGGLPETDDARPRVPDLFGGGLPKTDDARPRVLIPFGRGLPETDDAGPRVPWNGAEHEALGRPPGPSAPGEASPATVAADLVRRLDALLARTSRPRLRMGFPSGSAVSLAGAMAVEADPRRADSIWQRRELPRGRPQRFQLLVDCSGSMKGAKIAAAVRGAEALAIALDRLGLRLEILGFQDELIPVKSFADVLGIARRQRLRELLLETCGRRPGGLNHAGCNDDGPCLRAAAQRLLATGPATEGWLVVLSDGSPAGRVGTPAESARELHDAVAAVTREGINLIGLGLGPATEHVTQYYPHRRANVPLKQLPAVLGELVQAALLRRPPTAGDAWTEGSVA